MTSCFTARHLSVGIVETYDACLCVTFLIHYYAKKNDLDYFNFLRVVRMLCEKCYDRFNVEYANKLRQVHASSMKCQICLGFANRDTNLLDVLKVMQNQIHDLQRQLGEK